MRWCFERMKAAGMIPFAKSTSPEQGWALNIESTMYGVTRNPWQIGTANFGLGTLSFEFASV